VLRKIILLINGSQVFMDITKKILERAGYSVRCASEFRVAQELFMDFTPDGIILGDDLPDIKGLDYCRQLRGKSAVPIMFLSNTKDDELEALQAGATDFLKKPFDYNILKARISVMLKSKVGVLAIDEEQLNGDKNIFPETAAKKQTSIPERETPAAGLKRMKIKRFYYSAAMFAVAVGIGAGMFYMINGSPANMEIPEEQGYLAIDESGVQLSEFEFPESREVIAPELADFTIAAEAADAEILLYNPEGNVCLMTFEITLEDTGETIYLSEPIKPGAAIESVTLTKGLAKGGHKAVIKIAVHEPENLTVIDNIEISMYITAN